MKSSALTFTLTRDAPPTTPQPLGSSLPGTFFIYSQVQPRHNFRQWAHTLELATTENSCVSKWHKPNPFFGTSSDLHFFPVGMQSSGWGFLVMTKWSRAIKTRGKNQNRVKWEHAAEPIPWSAWPAWLLMLVIVPVRKPSQNPCSHCSSSNLNWTYDPCNTEGAFCTASKSNTASGILFSTILHFPIGKKQ